MKEGRTSNDSFIITHFLIVLQFYTSYLVMAGLATSLLNSNYWAQTEKNGFTKAN
jgi:uncharacterized membrane protein (DUF485 family)